MNVELTHKQNTDPAAEHDPQVSSQQIHARLLEQFTLQRHSFLSSEAEKYEERKAHLLNLKSMLTENKDAIIEAISKDYGNRSRHETLFAEFIAVVGDINSTIKHLKKWMKVQRRSVDMSLFFGAKNKVIPQPLGVVGIIVPWNFPVNLTFSQLSAVFAAGNRAMVKMSENSVHLSELLRSIVGNYFSPEKLSINTETGGVGIEFSQIPFDHLIFTGSGATGRKVMASAAANLTPVTLELGGKCPAIIDPNYPLQKAVDRIMFVKCFNAGQICTSVDYVFVHESQVEQFAEMAQKWVAKHVPDIMSDDYTSIIDDVSFQRIQATLADAQEKGAQIVNLNGQTSSEEARKQAPTLVMNTNEDMMIRNRETFGPLLLLLPYKTPEDVIAYINSKDRPLAIYPFSQNSQLLDLYIGRIMSGGVTVNDALFHVAQHDLPFGGVGASGMGHYHGYEGFLNFSKLRPIMKQANITSGRFLAPPYSKGITHRLINLLTKLKVK